ncbi:hypothetical protein BpHYR1_020956 [Brachionus plicatilis]|uniref:Uncharacterized protein n=1 Tax=Brachionus plicatilis TaxID=10195 RepID=A0A3M7RT90_BRAPC|nr:hypothetical protein BpHYR1_020956 [Brachionus plicatilis]
MVLINRNSCHLYLASLRHSREAELVKSQSHESGSKLFFSLNGVLRAAKIATWNGKKSYDCDPDRWIAVPASFFGGLVQV